VVNRELTRENIADMFVTLYYARIDLSTGLVRHASGGHPGPILLGETRMPSVVELRNGPILGAIEEAEYADTLLTLAEGEGLCLYTDGVTETLDPEGRLNGEDWVLRQMESLRTRPAADVVEGIRMALGRYRGEAEPHDDVTLLAFRRPQGPTRREKDHESPQGRPM
jgi:serine phosphatase RsbU (regulator of sigma subunit)